MVKISKENLFYVDKRQRSSARGRSITSYEVPKSYRKCVSLTVLARDSKREEVHEKITQKLNTKNQKKLRNEKRLKNCMLQSNVSGYEVSDDLRELYFEFQFTSLQALRGLHCDRALASALHGMPNCYRFWRAVFAKFGPAELFTGEIIDKIAQYYHGLFVMQLPDGFVFEQQMFGNLATVGLDEPTLDRLDNFTELLDKLTQHMEKGVSVSVNFDVSGAIKVIAIPLACAIACAMASRGHIKLLVGLFSVAPLIFLDFVPVKDRVLALLKTFLDCDVNTQSISQTTFVKITEIIFLLFSCSMFDSASVKSKFVSFMKIGQAKSKGFSGMTDVAMSTVAIFEDVVNFVKHDLLGLDKVRFVERGCVEVIAWMEDIDKIVHEHESGQLTINLASFDRVSVLKTIGCRIIKDTAKDELKNLKFSINHYLKKLSVIDGEFQKAAIFKSGLRRKPLTVCLVGKSGVGKSAATIPLINSLMVRTLDLDSLEHYATNNMDFIYSRNFETKFWDGYRGHKVCVFDDFLQAVENPSDPDGESMNMIRASNLFPYKLHMAHLEDKGHSYFSSSVIFCTTNMFGLNTTQIKEQEALKRRFDVYCEIYPKLEYCVDQHNADLKARRLKPLVGSVFNKEVYEFHVRDSEARVMSYAQFEDHLEAKYHQVVNGSGQYLDAVSNDLKEMIARRKAIDAPAFFDAVETQMNWRLYFNLKRVGQSAKMVEIKRADSLLKVFLRIFGQSVYDQVRKHKRTYDEMVLDCTSYNESTPLSFFFSWNVWLKENMVNCMDMSPGRFVQCFENSFIGSVTPQMNTEVNESKNVLASLLDSLSASMNDPYYVPKIERSTDMACTEEEFRCDDCELTLSEKRVNPIIEGVKKFASDIKAGFEKVLDKYPIIKYCALVLPVISASLGVWFYLSRDIDGNNNTQRNVIRPEKIDSYKSDYQSQEFGRVAKTRIQVRPSSMFKPSVQSSEFGRVGKTRIAPRTSSSYQYSQQMMSMENTTRDEADSLIARNQYVMIGDGVRLGLVTAVGGDVMMANHHYYENLSMFLEEGKMSEVKFVPVFSFIDGKSTGQVALISNLLKFKPDINDAENDLWFFRVKGMRPHRHIEKRFVSQRMMDEFYLVGVPMTIFLQRNGIEAITRLAQRSCNRINLKTPASEVVYCDYLMYGANTVAGDCGSLILLNCEMTQGGRLMGIHSSLTREGGFCIGVVVTEERVKTALDRLSASGVVPQGCFVDNDVTAFGLPKVGHYKDGPHVARKTKLRPSPLHGKLDKVTREPAILEPRGGIDPYVTCIEKYACDNRQVDECVLENAASHYLQRLIRVSDGFSREKLSFEQACVGIKDEPYLNAIPRNTSAGYPWCNYGVAKWEFFGRDDEYRLDSDACLQLRAQVQKCEMMLGSGERPLFMFMDCMKDELRSEEKIRNMKTRMISACPLDLTILIKQYFGRFSDFMMKTRIHNGCAVGINAVSREWDHMSRVLQSKGTNMVAGDFGSFDATQYSMVLIEICHMINKWYNDGEQNANVRLILWHEVWNSVHLHGRDAVMLDHCLSSGNPLTVIVNSIYVQLLIRMGWISAHGNNVCSLDIFDENCVAISYGDDHIMGISDSSIAYFNYHSMITEMNRMGLVYTDEEKSANPPTCKLIGECSFLKRGFIMNSLTGRYEAPLAWSTIRDMPCWYRKGPNVHERVMTNCINSLREASLHDRAKFEKHLAQIQAAILPLRLPSESWEYYRNSLTMQWRDEEEETASVGNRDQVTTEAHFLH